MIYETLMTGPPDGAEMCEKRYENCSTVSGKVLNLPARHYVAESHICKFIAENSSTLEKKGVTAHAFSKPLKGVFHNIYLNLSIFYESFLSGTLLYNTNQTKSQVGKTIFQLWHQIP